MQTKQPLGVHNNIMCCPVTVTSRPATTECAISDGKQIFTKKNKKKAAFNKLHVDSLTSGLSEISEHIFSLLQLNKTNKIIYSRN
jgi:hypothetical protein